MPVRHYTITLDGTVQNLKDEAPGRIGDDYIKALTFQAASGNTGIVGVGSAEDVPSLTDNIFRIEIPASTIPQAPFFLEFSQNTINLVDWALIGTSADEVKIGVIW